MSMKASVLSIVAVLALCGACLAEAPYPLLMVSAYGSHYAVGLGVGQTLRTRIASYVNNNDFLNRVLLPFYNTPKGREYYEKFLSANKQTYPNVYSELSGTADGAGIPVHKLILLSLQNEMGHLAAGPGKRLLFDEGCSDVHVSTSAELLLGHNEDIDEAMRNNSYVLDARFDDGEHVTAYTYPGNIPGNAWGFNRYGLVFSTNGLYPKKVFVGGLGRYWIGRDLLAAKDMKDAIRRATVKGSAFGMSINIGSIREKTMVNIEISPDGSDVQTTKDVYYHFNMYRRLKIEQYADTSTLHRQARADEMQKPTTADGVRAILGDQKDSEYLIYRSMRPTDGCLTAATVVYDLRRLTATVYTNNPKDMTPVLELRLPDV